MTETATKKDKDLKITVHDEDDGSVFKIEGEPQEQVEAVVQRLYSDHLRRERREGDRLRCDANGDDVFVHLAEHLQAYRSTHCRELVWNFLGDQGGAAA
jgi:hypothetical protein